MKRTTQHPTHEQACAVLRFATTNGKAWKRALEEHWLNECSAHRLNANDAALLRQVRNQCGPTWLNGVTLPALEAQCTKTFLDLAEILARKAYGLTLDDLGIEEGGVLESILNGESVLDLVNDPAQDSDLGRIDKSDYGVPSTAELNQEDLAAALEELNALKEVQP
jgi:hypothetical protein